MDDEPEIELVEEESRPFRFVSGHYFFCRRLELPDELEEGEELQSFVELSVEALSPFPLEQLAWGYLKDLESRSVFLYAACRPRISQDETELWEGATHVFPAFLPCLLKSHSKPVVEVILEEHSVSLLYFDGEQAFPEKVISAPLLEDSEEADVSDLIDRLRKRLNAPAVASSMHPLRLDKTKGDSDELTFHLLASPSSELEEIQFKGEDAVWAADIRDDDFILAERKRRVASQRIWTAFSAAGIAVAVVLCLFLLSLVGNFLISSRKSLVQEQDPSVFSIQQNSDFLVQLEQFSGEPFQPFKVLATANAVLLERQPRRIEFTSVALNTSDELSIQGSSANVAEVNNYSDRLRGSATFSEVDLTDIRTRRGEVNFSLNLRFIRGVLPEEVIEPEPEALDEDEPTETVASNDTPAKESSETEPETPDAEN